VHIVQIHSHVKLKQQVVYQFFNHVLNNSVRQSLNVTYAQLKMMSANGVHLLELVS